MNLRSDKRKVEEEVAIDRDRLRLRSDVDYEYENSKYASESLTADQSISALCNIINHIFVIFVNTRHAIKM